MNDIQLLRFCFVIAFLGLGALFILSQTVEGEIVAIREITEEKIGQKVVIHGIVHDIRQIKSMTLFTLEDYLGADILVVSFSAVDIEEETSITVTGTVKEYKGELEVVAEKILRD